MLLIVGLLIASLIVGCSQSAAEPAEPAEVAEPAEEESEAQPEAAEEENPYEDIKIALVTDPIGNEQFLLQAYNMVKEMGEEYGFQWTSMECTDAAKWEENGRAAANEGFDLVIGVGWQAGDPFSTLADEFEEVKYTVIDTVVPNEKVTSIGFNETEGNYVLGVLIGNAFPDEELYGYIGNFQTQANYKYFYGYSEGVKSVNPDAEFIRNYIDSYTDTSLTYEFATQQQAAGARVIMGSVSSGANEGIYQAALDLAEKGTPIYTTGLSIDQTTPDNPYIIAGSLKNTGVTTEYIISGFLDGTLGSGPQILSLKENAFGVVHVTTETSNYINSDIITAEAVAAAKAVAEQFASGELTMVAPEETIE